MSVYWIVFYFAFIFAALAQRLRYTNLRLLGIVSASVVAIILFTYSGLRYAKGDTGGYFYRFNRMPLEFGNIFEERSYEKGFTMLTWLVKVIWNDPQVFIFVTALVTMTCIIIVFYKFSSNFELSVYLFIASNAYAISMNGVRQYMASAIIFAGLKWLLDGKWIPYCLLVLFASTIHSSALVLIPVYFIVRRRAWSWPVLSLVVLAVGLFAFLSNLLPGLFSMIESEQYSRYEGYIASQPDRGANVMRVIIAALPVVFAFIYREKLRNAIPHSDIFVNIGVLNSIILLYATFNWIFARYCIYFEIYNMLLIPFILRSVFKGKALVLAYAAVFLFYLVLFYFDSAIDFYVGYKSYFIPDYI